VAHRKLKTYSGGMKRRVGIAQALLNDPRLLIVDEPTAGLDPEERIRFRNLLSDLGGNRTILLSTHIVEDIAQTCQKLAVMKNGRVIFQGTAADLLRDTRDKAWIITTQGIKPEGNFTVVSTLNMGTAVQYRVVGELSPRAGAIAAAPTLEDGYVWLMRDRRAPANAIPSHKENKIPCINRKPFLALCATNSACKFTAVPSGSHSSASPRYFLPSYPARTGCTKQKRHPLMTLQAGH
jgi:ABC-2 type transport system ATP-binding protein